MPNSVREWNGAATITLSLRHQRRQQRGTEANRSHVSVVWSETTILLKICSCPDGINAQSEAQKIADLEQKGGGGSGVPLTHRELLTALSVDHFHWLLMAKRHRLQNSPIVKYVQIRWNDNPPGFASKSCCSAPTLHCVYIRLQIF